MINRKDAAKEFIKTMDKMKKQSKESKWCKHIMPLTTNGVQLLPSVNSCLKCKSYLLSFYNSDDGVRIHCTRCCQDWNAGSYTKPKQEHEL